MADKAYYDVTGRVFLPGPIPFKVSLIVRTEDGSNPEQAVRDWCKKGGCSFKDGDVEIDPNGEFELTEPKSLKLEPASPGDREQIENLTGVIMYLRDNGKATIAIDNIALIDAK